VQGRGIFQLGGERTGANPGLESFDHAKDPVDMARPDAQPDQRTGSGGRGAGHKGIGAVIQVEQGALRAFSQHALAAAKRFVDQQRGIIHVRGKRAGVAQVLLRHGLGIQRCGAV